MASIKDAVEEVIQDNNSILKFIIFAIPLYFAVTSYINSNMSAFRFVAIVTYFLLFGFLIEVTSNVRNGREFILPPFNIIKIFLSGIKGTIALGPFIALCGFAGYKLSEKISIADPAIDKVVKFIIWAICISIILTNYLCYSKRFKIIDVYNFRAISNHCIDIMLYVIFMIPQIAIVDAIILTPILYIMWLFFGLNHNISIFFMCVVAIYNLGIIGHYMAQTDYEVIQD